MDRRSRGYRNDDFWHYQCIIHSNENLDHGSSGGVTLKANFDLQQSILTETGQEITLVQFISIHFGGAFIPYAAIVYLMSSIESYEDYRLDDIQFLHECKACDQHEQTPV